jgi:hypothetical protein
MAPGEPPTPFRRLPRSQGAVKYLSINRKPLRGYVDEMGPCYKQEALPGPVDEIGTAV